jgi:hypothetical protein
VDNNAMTRLSSRSTLEIDIPTRLGQRVAQQRHRTTGPVDISSGRRAATFRALMRRQT